MARNHLNEIEAEIAPIQIFITTWMRKEAENIGVNRTMVNNLLKVLSPRKSEQYPALVTGSKHYLGPFQLMSYDGKLNAAAISLFRKKPLKIFCS